MTEKKKEAVWNTYSEAEKKELEELPEEVMEEEIEEGNE